MPWRAGHVLVRAGGADGAALLRAEEPVEQRDHRGGEEQQQRQRIFRQQLAHGREGAHIALGNEQVVLIHADRLIRLALHDAQVDRVERELREDTGKDGGNAALRVKKARDKTRQHTGEHRAQKRRPRAHARANEHHADRAAGGERAVHRQIRHVKDAVGDVYADRHDAPDQTLGDCAGQRVEQRRQETHRSFPPNTSLWERGGALSHRGYSAYSAMAV